MTNKKSILILRGTPKASFEFYDLPSWNKTINQHFRSRGADAKKMRDEGMSMAKNFMRKVKSKKPMIKRGLVVVNVWTGNEKVRDIYNVNIKHVFDGFVDSGLLIDDEFVYVPLTLMVWAGFDDNPKYNKRRGKTRKYAMTRTVIDIYELGHFIINGEDQVLPEGREEVL